MDRLLAAATLWLLAVAGCSSSGPQRLVGGDAVLTSVSFDQKWVAVLTGTTRLANGTHLGQLAVVPAAGGAPTVLDAHSAGGVFNRGTTLWYLGGVSVVSEGAPPVDHIYGALYLWRPELPAPIKVGSDVREYYVSANGASCVFMDWASPTNDPSNLGTLLAVRAASCTGSGCKPIAIDRNLTLAQTAWRFTGDGVHVLVAERGVGPTDPGKVLLLSTDSGQLQLLSSGTNPRSPMITPAGDSVAWVEGANEIHVVPTAGGAPTVITPTAALLDSASLIDAGNFIGKSRDLATDPPSLARISAAGTTLLPLGDRPQQYFVSTAVPGKSDHYVFYSLATVASNGAPDLWMLDFTAANPQPVGLAGAVDLSIGGVVGFSDDGSTIQLLDNFDPVTRRGDEYIVPLARPTRSLVAVGVHNAAFIPGSTRLLYINAPDAATGAGVLTVLPSPTALAEIQSVGVVNFINTRQAPARTWFTQTTGAPDDGVWFMPQP